MPQFVILRHTMPKGSERPSHFDLMLELEGALLTWALDELPTKNMPQPARELPPHRLAYLTYEGPISNNRGHVVKIAKGSIEWLVRDSAYLELEIDGGQWFGRIVLQRIGGEQWTVTLFQE